MKRAALIWMLGMALLTPGLAAPTAPGSPTAPPIVSEPVDPRILALGELLDNARMGGTLNRDHWIAICEGVGIHPLLKAQAARIEPFPMAMVEPLLGHERLRVRVGAIELLENLAGTSLGYDPWEPDSAPSLAAREKWKAWKPGGEKEENQAATLDESKFLGYLADVVAEDADRRERAMAMLGEFKLLPVAMMERYLSSHPELPDHGKARIREAQYRLVIQQNMPNDAPKLARDLVYGIQDAKLAAMQQLPRCGLRALPILVQNLDDPNALVREAAVDLSLQLGGPRVYDLIEKRLNVETDDNIIHVALRRIEANNPQGVILLTHYVDHANEDLAVVSLEALGKVKSPAALAKIGKLLKDERWRVRVAALDYASSLEDKRAEAPILEALNDKDEFVRYAAIKAAAGQKSPGVRTRLIKLATGDPALLAPVVSSLVQNRGDPFGGAYSLGKRDVIAPELRAAIGKASGEALIPVVTLIGQHMLESNEHKKEGIAILRSLQDHADPDVRHAVAAALAEKLDEDAPSRAIVLRAMREAQPDGLEQLLMAVKTGWMSIPSSLRLPEGAAAPDPAPDIYDRVLSLPVTPNPELDRLYDALVDGFTPENPRPTPIPSAPAESAPSAALPGENPESATWRIQLERWMGTSGTGPTGFFAALRLAETGHAGAIRLLAQSLPARSPQDRLYMAYGLPVELRKAELRQIWTQLVNDPSPEARGRAIYRVLQSAEGVALIMEQMTAPNTPMTASELYENGFPDAARVAANRKTFQPWFLAASQPNQPRDQRLLAFLSATSFKDAESRAALERGLSDADPYARRAAWRTLSWQDRSRFEDLIGKAAQDQSALVRQTIPAHFYKGDHQPYWKTIFGEQEEAYEDIDYSLRGNPRGRSLSPEGEAALRAMLEDPLPATRMAAAITLLSHDKQVPTWPLKQALDELPPKTRADWLRSILNDHWRTLSPAYSFILDYADRANFGEDTWSQMTQRLSPGAKDANLTTFASILALEIPEAGAETKPAEAAVPVAAPADTARQTEARLIFYYKSGCQDCERVRDTLKTLAGQEKALRVEEVDIESHHGAESNEVLCERFSVPVNQRGVAPAVFMQGGFLIKDDVRSGTIQGLITRTLSLAPDAKWMQVSSSEQALASERMKERFARFGFGWVLLAGLLDGINPCAFATIIFFLSYLQVARRSPVEILMVGSAFVFAVFLAYFLAGLGLSQVLTRLEGFQWMRTLMNWLLGGIALVIAVLSFRDGVLALRGDLKGAALQLPGFLKERIRGVIREKARARNFVAAAFVSGIVISFLELACTGQMYLPTILYMIKEKEATAYGWLLAYNLAFVLPLIVIFVLAYLGMKSDTLIQFQLKHTAAVRFATAALFVGLLFMLFWGPSWGA